MDYATRRYQPRHAEASVLRTIIREHLDDFLRAAADRGDGAGLPEFIAREVREFLTCGVRAHGIARVRCERCALERLVPFLCKGRGFCPSCGGRRMTERAAHVVDEVLPPVPVRQWVLTLPYRLRYLLAWDHGLSRAVLAVHARAAGVLSRAGPKAWHRGGPHRDADGEVFTQEWDPQAGTMGLCRERGVHNGRPIENVTVSGEDSGAPGRARVRDRPRGCAHGPGLWPGPQDRAQVARPLSAQGEPGLVPRYPTRRPRRIPEETVALIADARTECRYGACRTRLWLIRVQEGTVGTKTITRICDDLGVPPLQRVKRRRAPRQLTLCEKPNPGDSVQVDVKVVKLAGTKADQYTACDDCPCSRVLRLYRRLDQRGSLDFLAEVRRRRPFAIRRVQTDHGTEFAFAFVLAVEQAGIRHRYIRPRCPQQNGKIERSHRIDAEEFWGRHEFAGFEDAAQAVRDWEQVYNYVRFSMALHGRMPAEKLAAVLPAA